MGGQLKDAVKHEGATLEKDVAPVPAVVFDDMMRLCLHPQIEGDKGNTTNPSTGVRLMTNSDNNRTAYLIICAAIERPSGTR